MNVFIETHGCELNKAESNSIILLLKNRGFHITDNPQSADVIIMNTCSVRETAETRVYGQLGVYKSYKEKNGTVIILTGCMAEHDIDYIQTRFPFIDFIVKNNDKGDIANIISLLNDKKRVVVAKNDEYKFFTSHIDENSIENYVPIQNGCNNFCSYCIVPFTRGRETCRNFDSIIDEIKALDKKNVKIITLLGQNVNSYNASGHNFEDLVKKIDTLPLSNVKWINFESPHPKYFTDELIDILSSSKYFVHHYHIPIQSASDRILSLMNRRYTKKDIEKLFDNIRKKIPDATFSSDIMMGFPTETDKEAEETISFVKEMRFLDNFMYYYNPRPGTMANKSYEDLPKDVKIARLEELIKTQRKISSQIRDSYIGSFMDVIIKSKSKDGKMLAVNSSRISVIVDGGEVNEIKNVKIISRSGSTLLT